MAVALEKRICDVSLTNSKRPSASVMLTPTPGVRDRAVHNALGSPTGTRKCGESGLGDGSVEDSKRISESRCIVSRRKTGLLPPDFRRSWFGGKSQGKDLDVVEAPSIVMEVSNRNEAIGS